MTPPPLRRAAPLLALLFLSAADALAADSARVTARREFERGSALYQEARYAEAVTAFEASYRAKPNGVVLYNLAQCEEKLGQLDKAVEHYREYLRQVPKAEDRAAVTSVIASLEEKVAANRRPQVTVRSTPPGATVTLDGTLRGPTPWADRLDTGAHRLELNHPGYQPLQRALEVRSGEPVQLDLSLLPIAPPEQATLTAEPTGPRSRTWTWVAASATAAALITAGTFGILAQQQSSTLLGAKHDQPEVQGLHDRAISQAKTANILYGVAGGAGAVTVALFFVEGRF